jgi:hypothetical protein
VQGADERRVLVGHEAPRGQENESTVPLAERLEAFEITALRRALDDDVRTPPQVTPDRDDGHLIEGLGQGAGPWQRENLGSHVHVAKGRGGRGHPEGLERLEREGAVRDRAHAALGKVSS